MLLTADTMIKLRQFCIPRRRSQSDHGTFLLACLLCFANSARTLAIITTTSAPIAAATSAGAAISAGAATCEAHDSGCRDAGVSQTERVETQGDTLVAAVRVTGQIPRIAWPSGDEGDTRNFVLQLIEGDQPVVLKSPPTSLRAWVESAQWDADVISHSVPLMHGVKVMPSMDTDYMYPSDLPMAAIPELMRGYR